MVIDTTSLCILIPVWMTLTFFFLRKAKSAVLLFLQISQLNLLIWMKFKMLHWFICRLVEAHTRFILQDQHSSELTNRGNFIKFTFNIGLYLDAYELISFKNHHDFLSRPQGYKKGETCAVVQKAAQTFAVVGYTREMTKKCGKMWIILAFACLVSWSWCQLFQKSSTGDLIRKRNKSKLSVSCA